MKKIFYFLLVGLVPFLASCDKEKTVILKQSGTLTFKVVDNDGNGIDKAKISIGSIVYDSTDVSGVYKTEELLEGVYNFSIEAKKPGGKAPYRYSRSIQVIAGENKYIEVNPFEYSSKVTITLKDGNNNPLSWNILICPDAYQNSLEEYKESAYYTGKATDQGRIYFDEIPYNSYTVVYYSDNNNSGYRTDYIYVNDPTESFNFRSYWW